MCSGRMALAFPFQNNKEDPMKAIDTFEKSLLSLNKRLALLGASFLLVEMFFTITNIAGRYLFSKPIRSTYEVCQLFMLIVLSLCWAYTENVGGHIRVDIFEVFFPKLLRRILSIVMQLLGLVVFVILTVSLVVTGIQFKKMGSNTDALEIPYFPFAFLMALGAALTVIVMLSGFYHVFKKSSDKGD